MLETDNQAPLKTMIRPIQSIDIPVLSEYWYDWMALQSQSNRHIWLAPSARQLWETAIQEQLQLASTIGYIIASNEDTLGCIIGCIVNNQPGLLPLQIGFVDYLLVDLHAPKQKPALGGLLLDTFQSHLRRHDITVMCVHSVVYSAVQQAFWRGENAKHIGDIFWINL